MTEELGEIARAYLHDDVEGRPVEMSSQELMQLTAICLRALGDWTTAKIPTTREVLGTVGCCDLLKEPSAGR